VLELGWALHPPRKAGSGDDGEEGEEEEDPELEFSLAAFDVKVRHFGGIGALALSWVKEEARRQTLLF
jgi:hypothetical protein